MALTIEEISERLAVRYDHEELCDLLGISTEKLLERFDDYIAEHYDRLVEELEE